MNPSHALAMIGECVVYVVATLLIASPQIILLQILPAENLLNVFILAASKKVASEFVTKVGSPFSTCWARLRKLKMMRD